MKVKKDIDLTILLDYGFQKIDKEDEKENENWTIASYDYAYNIGHSRRGQFYYLLVDEATRAIDIYASKPDGSGTSIRLPDVLIRLITDNIIGTESGEKKSDKH